MPAWLKGKSRWLLTTRFQVRVLARAMRARGASATHRSDKPGRAGSTPAAPIGESPRRLADRPPGCEPGGPGSIPGAGDSTGARKREQEHPGPAGRVLLRIRKMRERSEPHFAIIPGAGVRRGAWLNRTERLPSKQSDGGSNPPAPAASTGSTSMTIRAMSDKQYIRWAPNWARCSGTTRNRAGIQTPPHSPAIDHFGAYRVLDF